MAEKWAMAACVPGSVHSLDWPPAIWLRGENCLFLYSVSMGLWFLCFSKPCPRSEWAKNAFRRADVVIPKGVGRRAGSSNWSVYFFILSQRWSTEGQQPGVLEGEEVGETPGWGKRCVCARVSTRVYVHVHCTARPRVYAVSKWMWRDLFCLSQLLSMFEIYYMGKSFPTAPSWKKI